MVERKTRRRARRRAGPRGALAASRTPLIAALRTACTDLDKAGLRYALVGGLAVSARAEPRLTRDVDVAVAVADDVEAERVIRTFVGLGYRVDSTVEQSASKRLATVRLRRAGSLVVVDLLFASCGIESDIVAASEALEILPGVRVPVARAGHLIAMKLLAADDRRRPQDHDDIRALLATSNHIEIRRVGSAIRAIQQRGYARGRDLAALWRNARR